MQYFLFMIICIACFHLLFFKLFILFQLAPYSLFVLFISQCYINSWTDQQLQNTTQQHREMKTESKA